MNQRKTQAEQFEQLLAPHMNMLYKTAWRLVGSSDEAEDLVQQVLVKLYPKTAKMQTIDRLAPWLKQVLYREFIDNFRKKSRRPENFLSTRGNPIEHFGENEHNPEKLVERAGNAQRVQAALDKLDGDNRALILMHLVEGYTLAELGEIFYAPPETLKTRLRRAKARLKKLLQT